MTDYKDLIAMAKATAETFPDLPPAIRNHLRQLADALEAQQKIIDEIIIGWREHDYPEGFCRFTAQYISDRVQATQPPEDE